jgi:hypothetical protein
MVDPRLNSIHLESLPRRQEFRQARQALLAARGPRTLGAEVSRGASANPEVPNNTVMQNRGPQLRGGLKFVLMDKDYVYPLKVGLNTIGRMPDNDVVIPDSCISRRHCAILVHTASGCELHDVASKNGTYVNGKRLTGPTHLNSGDEICMCNRQFVFVTRNECGDDGGADEASNSRTQCG